MSLKGNAESSVLRGKINNCDVLTLSAYGIAVKNGFEGTEEEWLESLKGENGENGSSYILTEADKEEIVDEVKESGVLMYTEQTLTEAQKAQARANIGAQTDDWFLIADITSTEAVSLFEISKDVNGEPFLCRRIIAFVQLPEALSGDRNTRYGAGESINNLKLYSFNFTSDGLFAMLDMEKLGEGSDAIKFHFSNSSLGHFWGNGIQGTMIRRYGNFSGFFYKWILNRTNGGTFPVGTKLTLWGVKA